MKINFWTSTEYGGFMYALMRSLNKLGIPAVQKFTISETFYRSARSPLSRFLLRLRQYIVYPLQLSLSLIGQWLKGHSRVPVVVSTNTFFAPLLATVFNQRVIHLVYDLFPEAMIYSGKWKEGQLRVRFFRWLVGLSIKHAKVNVFLGERLKNYVESIHGELNNAVVIPVGADEAPFQQVSKWQDGNPIQVLYCGNFGNMHESQTLFDAWLSGLEPAVQFRFHCSGPKRKELIAFVAAHSSELKDQVLVNEGLPFDEWVTAMQRSQVALVTMSEGSESVVMPSKTYSALMAGQAVLAVAPEKSDLVDLIKQTECGWWVSPGDVEGLIHVLSKIASDPEELEIKRQNAFRVAHEQFGQAALARQWSELFANLNQQNSGY